jgi:hypothetical protein
MDIRDDRLSTTQQLNERWIKCYEQSEQAILKHPEIYKKLLSLIDEVCFGIVDIDEYYDLAAALSECLHQMGGDTIFFNYFYEQIHPSRHGTARFFRALCRDLSEQIDALNRWRKTRRCLSLVKF